MPSILRVLSPGAFLLLAATCAQAAFPTTVTIRNFFRAGNDSLTFDRPVLAKPYLAEDSAFIVVQQAGKILTVRWNGSAWRATDTATVPVLGGANGIDEQGLLGFAFHPNYASNRKYYIYYVDGTANKRFDVVAERTAGISLRPATADAQRTVLRVSDPYDNHNAGSLGFDGEGYLVLAIGDGGTTNGDPENRAQNPDSLLGKFLRLDVNGTDEFPADTTRNYAIPSTNPFKDSTNYRPEIWALGLRNPWKWTIHPVTGEIWVGDVGQDRYEEISSVPKGANLGWRQREADSCFKPATGCLSEGIQPTALVLNRKAATVITGGTFFIGNPSSAFQGAYIFGDHGKHSIWAARVQDGHLVDTTKIGTINKVTSFDRDRQGRILATNISSDAGFSINSNVGRVYVLESPDMALSSVSLRSGRSERLPAPSIKLTDLLREPEAYAVTGLDGRAARLLSHPRGTVNGAFLVHKKGSSAPVQLMWIDW